MKNIIAVLLAFAFVFAVSGCVGGQNTVEKEQNTVSGQTDNIDYSSVQQKMSNFVNNSYYCIKDGWIYYLNYDGKAQLTKIRTDGSDFSVLVSGKGVPSYVTVDGEYVYALFSKDESSCLYRCRLGGSDLTKIISSDIDCFQMHENKIWYAKWDMSANKTKGYYCCNMDGSNEELVLDKEIYNSYVVGDVLYYQDDDDNETIHKYNLETKTDEKITNKMSYCFVIDGTYGYYIQTDKTASKCDYNGRVVKVNLTTKEEIVLYEGAYTGTLYVTETEIYFVNNNDNKRIYKINKDGTDIKLVTQDTKSMYIVSFDNKMMYMKFNSEGTKVEGIYICNLSDGSNKINILKNQ